MKTALLSILFASVMIGGWSAAPQHLTARGMAGCTGEEECCSVTTDCGSPSAWRCCVPQGGEAPCGRTCKNYCKSSSEEACNES